MKIRSYATMLAVVAGSLQRDQTGVAVSSCIEAGRLVHRVTLDSAVPTDGFEFDGRQHVGTDHEFSVSVMLLATMGDVPREDANPSVLADWMAGNPVAVQLRDARVVAFEVHKAMGNTPAFARTVFESTAPLGRDVVAQ